ncbi:MAG: methyl-accepting chemotaxis protein [Hydrogenovibrio sp.]|uniref:methyl-accepting chemotaxis protein n=1 Tax=Hydrogenovibrio sp. TaxID=2065821 RepID=UPI00287011AF|nr:methyl-accepting chemotaxis protein [Hydrogenovibrio sp.]MDR9500045.1 methyl-accepting chemotaxis protein [Hydrogenovibrio sp.]
MIEAAKQKRLKTDKTVLYLLLAHVPFVGIFAPMGYGTETFALIAALGVGVLSLVAYGLLRGTRWFGVVTGVLVMLSSAILIQAQLGRIEMHFHIFVGLAFLLIFKDWLAILVAALVGAVHHVVLTFLQLAEVSIWQMPVMLFNYDCNWSITFLHAFFVVIEAAVLIYYSFEMKKDEQIMQATINSVGKVVQKGDFGSRITQHTHEPSVQAFNRMLETVGEAIDEISAVMSDVSKGMFNRRIQGQYTGDLDELKGDVNTTAEALETVMGQLNHSLEAFKNGDFSQAVPEMASMHGGFKQALDNTEQARTALDAALTELDEVANRMRASDFSKPVQAQLSGQLDALKTNLNGALSDLDDGFEAFNESLNALIHGDLTVQVSGHYDGQLSRLQSTINQSMANLSEQFESIKTAATETLQNVQQVASGNNELNERTQNQAASIEQTAASMEEMTASVQQALESAKRVEHQASETQTSAKEGAQVMEQTREAISSIHESSEKMANIVGMIDSIAFQTNLLALNAAVEAARAGEHGRGFAVVAQEVRALAQKSSDAAKDIAQLIHQTTDLIQNGADLSEKSSQQLNAIVQSVEEVAQRMSEIRNHSSEQSNGIAQINQAIGSMDQATQQNAALVEQMNAANLDMEEKMTQLVEKTGNLKTKK